MNFLPIIARELRVQARQPSTNRVRWIAAAVVMALAACLMAAGGHTAPAERAKLIFIVISVVCLGFAMLAGVFQTADALSEERREGTLGLLFLTDLRGYDVVLGKLASTSLNAGYTFLAIMPVLALPLLMGGTTVGEFWRVSLVLLVTLYLSLGIGMGVSALSRDARSAMGATLLIMVLLAGLLPLLTWVAEAGQWGFNFDRLLVACPPYAFQRAFHIYYSGGRGAEIFWYSILTMGTLGTASLMAASLVLPRIWQENGANAKPQATNRAGQAGWSHSPAGARESGPSNDPFYWLAMRRNRSARAAAWIFAVLTTMWLCLFLAMWSENHRGAGMFFSLTLLMTFGMHLLLKSLIATEATRRLSEDRHSGALELLLVTPLTVREIMAGQSRAMWRSFAGQLTALTVMNLALLVFLAQSGIFRRDSDAAGIFGLVLVGGIAMLYLDMFALVRVGMWTALTCKRHARAFLATVLRILLPPWLAIFFFLFLGIIGAFGGGSGGPLGIIFLWFCIGGMTDIFGASPALANLETNFRAIAATGQAPPFFTHQPLSQAAAPASAT